MKGFSIRHLATINAECRGSMYLEIVKIAASTLGCADKLRDFSTVIWYSIYKDLTEKTPLYVGISETDYTINIGNFDENNNITDTRWFIIKIDSNDYVYADEIVITKINHPYTEKELVSYLCKVLMGVIDIEALITNVDCVVEESNSLIIKYMNGTMTRLQITNLDKEIINEDRQKEN